jgi:hypothetical protein
MSVYFARVRGYVKIGFSKDVYARMTAITSGSVARPADVHRDDSIDLLGWIQGDRTVEKSVQHKFGHLHVMGEWFWDDESFDEFLEADPFAVIHHRTSHEVVELMTEYPHVTRDQITQIVAADRAERLADPNSLLSQVHAITGITPEDVAEMNAEAAKRRAEDRAYWRSQREQATA